MTLDNPEQRSRETAAAGLVKGESACNRSACQAPLNVNDGSRWWNTSTRAYYCRRCAKRINDSCMQFKEEIICITESEKWRRDNDHLLKNAVKNTTIPSKRKIR